MTPAVLLCGCPMAGFVAWVEAEARFA